MMDYLKKRRRRAANFQHVETNILLNIVHKYGSIIENKSTNTTIWNKKEEAWQQVTLEFNSQQSVKRTSKMLKIKYESMKYALKRKIAHNESDSVTNGCESMIPYTVADKKIISIMALANLDGDTDFAEDKRVLVLKSQDNPNNLSDLPTYKYNVNYKENIGYTQEQELSTDEEHLAYNDNHYSDDDDEVDKTLLNAWKWKEKEYKLKILYNIKKLELIMLKNKRKEKDHALRILRKEKKLEFYILEDERKSKEHENRMLILEHQLSCIKREM